MSDTDAPQSTDTQAPAAPEVSGASAVHSAVPAPAAEAPSKKLSTFLKVSIALLIGLTLASISLVFIGDFEGKFERVFSTFVLFAVFVTFTAIDTSRERKSDWYAPVALIANTYILGLLLIVIWMTPYNSFSLLFDIFWKSVLVVVVTRLVILFCELLLLAGEKSGEAAARFAFVTSVLAVLSGILFTAPVGIEAFNLFIPDLYWKIATAVLILTALGLSITLLLGWAHRSDSRAERRAAAKSTLAQRPQSYVAENPYGVAHQPASPAPQPTVQSAQQRPAQPVQQAESELLPWPLFADGTPIPARPDGQPDFSVPGAPAPPQF